MAGGLALNLGAWQGIRAQFGGVAGDWRPIWGRGEGATTLETLVKTKNWREF